VHLPFPTPATLGYGHFHHEGKTPMVRGYFKSETVSLRSEQKGSLTPPTVSGTFRELGWPENMERQDAVKRRGRSGAYAP